MKKALFVLSVFILASVSFGFDVTFYVAKNGNDDFSGRLPGVNQNKTDGPFATLERAREAVKELRDEKGDVAGEINVLLREGVYRMEDTFLLEPEDGGNKKLEIIYRSREREKAVISGGVVIEDWERVKGDLPGLPEEAKGKIWSAEIEKDFKPHFMYVDGEPVGISEFPNGEFLEGDEGIREFGDPGPEGQKIKFPESVKEFIEYLPDNGDVEMSWIPIIWANGISVLKDFDVENNTAMRHSKNVLYKGNSKKDWMRGNRFKLLNAIPFINKKGEWCYDSDEGKIYWWPMVDNPDEHEVVCPKLYELFRLEGDEEKGEYVTDVTIEGLTFKHTDRMPEDEWPDEWLKRNFENPDAAVYMTGVENVTFKGNKVIDVGTYGVTLTNYAQKIQVVGNEIARTGCGGVQLFGYGPGTKDVNKNNIVKRNNIQDIGTSNYMHSAGISIFQSGHNEVTHNFLEDLPYAGIVIVGAHREYFNDYMKNGGWDPEKDKVYHHMDSYGNYKAQYNVRWNDFPEGTYKRMMKGENDFVHTDLYPYLHSRENLIAYNIVSKAMSFLKDGGALYPWACGKDNRWYCNIVLDSGDKSIYMDDYTLNTYIENNVCWRNGGTIAKKNGGESFWYGNSFGSEIRPEGYFDLLDEIMKDVKRDGGWPGDVELEKPSVCIDIDNGRLFTDKKWIRMETDVERAEIRYTRDGSEPTMESTYYDLPFPIYTSAKIRAKVFFKGEPVGESDYVPFVKIKEPVKPDVYFTDLDYELKEAKNKLVHFNSNVSKIFGTKFYNALNMYCDDEYICELEPEYKRFVAMIGIDDVSDPRASTVFEVKIDGETVYKSKKMTLESKPVHIDIPIPDGSEKISLKGTGFSVFYWVFGDWVNAGFMLE